VTRIDQNTDEFKRAELLAKIRHLESQQARPLRELALDPEDAAARDRVRELDDQIAELRAGGPAPYPSPRAAGGQPMESSGSERAIASGARLLILMVVVGVLVIVGIIRGAVWLARHVHFG
jgi:hypothetical protein